MHMRLPALRLARAATRRGWAARRPDRRADGVGRPRARGAGLRHDRRRLARRRPLRRPGRAAPLRGVRQLAPPGRRADVGDRRAVGGHRRATSSPRAARQFVALTAALAITTGLAALVAGLLRLGFLANFISEPVLKGFIIGLALTIIIGQVPKLFGVEKGERRLLRAALGPRSASLGDTSATTLLVGVLSLARRPRAQALAPSSRLAGRRARSAIVAVKACSTSTTTASTIVGPIKSGLPSFGLPGRRAGGLRRPRRPAARGRCSSASPRASARPRPTRPASTTRSTPTASCSGSERANVASGLSSGMVVNGSLSKTAVNGAAGARSQISGLVVRRPDGAHAAVPHRPVRGPARGDARRGGHRRRDRARRHRGARRGSTASTRRALAAILRRRRAARLHRRCRRDAGRARLRHAPRLFIGIAVSLLLLLYRASRPHIAVLGASRAATSGSTSSATPTNEPVPGVVVLRVESGLFFANAEHVRDAIRRHVEPTARRRSCSTPRRCRSIDVTRGADAR